MGLALVTGATGGIGRALCAVAAADGYDLLITDVAGVDALAEELRARFSVEVAPYAFDLSELEQARALVAAVADQPIEALLHGSGVDIFSRFDHLDPAEIESLLNVNLVSQVLVTRGVVSGMVARGRGRILTMASTAGFKANPYQSTYSGSKAFMLLFSEGLHLELKEAGIGVTCLAPGSTNTPFFRTAGIPVSDAQVAGFMDPSEVATQAWKSLNAGEFLVVPGLKNQAQYHLAHWAPKAMIHRWATWRANHRRSSSGGSDE